ncbi:hypothetical protein JZ751_025467 [Albula glossodonta]|uniref:Uncharacterized protein n=1 Tax=Albula glossodonta TaxID=121402 RepID=A0A8T2NED0_9TELE|nr:hypothetical protein JZ751_025467 [Albula glossodonta]
MRTLAPEAEERCTALRSYRCFIQALQRQKNAALPYGHTGVSSRLYRGRRTLHCPTVIPVFHPGITEAKERCTALRSYRCFIQALQRQKNTALPYGHTDDSETNESAPSSLSSPVSRGGHQGEQRSKDTPDTEDAGEDDDEEQPDTVLQLQEVIEQLRNVFPSEPVHWGWEFPLLQHSMLLGPERILDLQPLDEPSLPLAPLGSPAHTRSLGHCVDQQGLQLNQRGVEQRPSPILSGVSFQASHPFASQLHPQSAALSERHWRDGGGEGRWRSSWGRAERSTVLIKTFCLLGHGAHFSSDPIPREYGFPLQAPSLCTAPAACLDAVARIRSPWMLQSRLEASEWSVLVGPSFTMLLCAKVLPVAASSPTRLSRTAFSSLSISVLSIFSALAAFSSPTSLLGLPLGPVAGPLAPLPGLTPWLFSTFLCFFPALLFSSETVQ